MIILLPVLIPLFFALVFIFVKNNRKVNMTLAFTGVLLSLASVALLAGETAIFYMPVTGFDLALSFNVDNFAFFLLAALNVMALLVLCWSFSAEGAHGKWYYFAYLFSVAFANGAVMADNLIVMLFFWEGLLISLYMFLVMSEGPGARDTAFKAFIINIIGDVCLMAGVVLISASLPTLSFTEAIAFPVSLAGTGGAAFVFFCLGALAKAGAVPFHSWIPLAAKDTDISVMALLPGAFEKMLAVFLLGRIVSMFNVGASSGDNVFLMAMGLVSAIAALTMLLNEKDLKKFIAYNVVLQIGLLVFELGLNMDHDTLLGIANHGVYKAFALAGLFMTAGIIEKYTNTADSGKLGGLWGKMRGAAVCFIIFSLALCRLTPLDVFFSKNVYSVSFNNPVLLGVTVIIYSLMMLAFYQMFRRVFMDNGKAAAPDTPGQNKMLIPVILTALVVFLYEIGWAWEGGSPFMLAHAHWQAGAASGLIILAAFLAAGLYYSGAKKYGAENAIRIITGRLDGFYKKTSDNKIDTYALFNKAGNALSYALYKTDRVFDFLIDDMPRAVVKRLAKTGSLTQSGRNADYILWAVAGAAVFAILAFSGGWF